MPDGARQCRTRCYQASSDIQALVVRSIMTASIGGLSSPCGRAVSQGAGIRDDKGVGRAGGARRGRPGRSLKFEAGGEADQEPAAGHAMLL